MIDITRVIYSVLGYIQELYNVGEMNFKLFSMEVLVKNGPSVLTQSSKVSAVYNTAHVGPV